MEILAVADRIVRRIYTPSVKRRFAGVEIILGCGDLPAAYLDYIVSQLDVPLFYVVGNHQGEHTRHDAEGRPISPAGGFNLHRRTVEYRGLLLAGLEGSMRYSHSDHQYSELDMMLSVLALTPALIANRLKYGRYLDILVTHSPPLGIHDGEDLAHRGFRSFLWFMRQFRPRYLIHGHKHIYDSREATVTRYGDTIVVNAYGFQVIDFEQGVVGQPAAQEGEYSHGTPVH